MATGLKASCVQSDLEFDLAGYEGKKHTVNGQNRLAQTDATLQCEHHRLRFPFLSYFSLSF
jgi:hypothetical protein